MAKMIAESRPQSLPPSGADEYELVCAIYDLHRTLRMNALYYGKKLSTLQRWNTSLEISIAVSSAATVGSLAVFKPLLPYLAALAAILGVVKPILGIPKQIERYSKLWSDYIAISLETGRVVGQIQIYQKVTPEMEKIIEDVRDRFDELSKREDPYPNMKQLAKQQQAVDIELPSTRLWAPCAPAPV
jgi:hypothetical protein